MLRNNPNISSTDLLAGLDGNLCRCTGYRSIVDSMSTFGSDCPCKNNNKKNNENGTITTCCAGLDNEEDRVPCETLKLEQGEELIFPSELQLTPRTSKHLRGERSEVFLPITVSEFVELKEKFPNAIILGANSSRIFERATKGCIVISTSLVEEFRKVSISNGNLVVGGGANFSDVLDVLGNPEKNTLFGAIKTSFSTLGSTQVRNASTLAGNIILNDYNSDLLPLLMVTNSKVVLSSKNGNREVSIDDFIKGAGIKNVDIKEGEVISSIVIPQSAQNEFVVSYKMSRRPTTSRSIVGATCRVRLDGEVVADISLVFCGVSKVVKRALSTEKNLIGEKWDVQIIDKAFSHLGEELYSEIETVGEIGRASCRERV